MKHLLTTTLLLLSLLGYGQNYHLTQEHGVTAFNGDLALSSVHGNATTSRARMPDLWGWAKARGWSDAEILSLRHMEAGWHDLFWRGEAGNYNSSNPGHAINIEVPNGRFGITYPLIFAQGQYRGQGSRFSDYNGSHNYGSTHLYIVHGSWKSNRSADRIIMRSANWGIDGGYGAWVHHYVIEGFHFDGRRRSPWMPSGTAESAGIGAWDSGEASYINNCYFEGFEKDGILLVRGTPAHVMNCSMFNTSRFGIALVGGGSLTCTNISGDESGIGLIGVIPGYGRPGSGKVSVHGAKQETSTSAEFRPWKGSSFMYVDGWVSASIQGVSYASSWTTPYDFISWRRGPGNFSQIEVSGTLFFGNAPRCLFYDETGNHEYLFQGNAWQNTMQSFIWHETQGLQTPWGIITPNQRTGSRGRLQHVGPDGAADWASAQVYDPTGGAAPPPPPVDPPPPPPSCTYTTSAWSAWSTCTGGTQTRTRTVTASPAGCVGTAPAATESRACTVAPPPPPPVPTGDVIVVVNADDPASRAIADRYKALRGITDEVVLSLGNTDDITTAVLDRERAKLPAGKTLALCWTKPTRVQGQNSITSAIAHGYTTSFSSTGPHYGKTTGTRATLVYSTAVVESAVASDGTRPQGTIYVVLANDGGGTAPRGDGRAPQVTGAAADRIRAFLPQGVGLVVQDNRQGCAGECAGNELRGKSDVLAYFGSIYKQSGWATNTVLPGAYCDNLTSHGGHLPTGLGQTPITEFLPAASSGTVVEPWMSNSTTTARQFMRVDTFALAYFAQGRTFAESAYRSVERPWRLLIIGDPLAQPYGGASPPPPPPATCSWQFGSWSGWSRCSSFRQCRTRTVSSTVDGCVPDAPKPAEQECRGCLW